MTETPPTPSAAPEPEERSFFGIIVHSFFIIPFLIAVFCVILFAGIKLLTHEPQTAFDLLEDVKAGGETKRWQAAFELSKLLANPSMVPDQERFRNEMIKAYQSATDDDPRVRQYLALAMARSKDPAFLPPLLTALPTEKNENLYALIYALGMMGSPEATRPLSEFMESDDARIRSVTAVALGSLNDQEGKKFLKIALSDPEANVKWGSAISLARLNDGAGKGILLQLLDREYLAKFPEVDEYERNHLIIAAIDASAHLNDPELTAKIQGLSQTDANMKVRAAAMDALAKKNTK